MPKNKKSSGEKTAPESASKKPRSNAKAANTAGKKTARKTPARKPATAKTNTVKKSLQPKPPAKKAAPVKAPAKKKSAAAKVKTPAVKKAAVRTKKPAKKTTVAEPLGLDVRTTGFADPIGDVSDGEAQRALGSDDGDQTAGSEEYEYPTEPRPEAHLERLQKILSRAGIASRRHAEEMIVAGRVMVNGQVITQLGAKADPARDHIRVDNKLLQGAERHRTFLLNKPKGYVTTVSDPEGRPTVADLFSKFSERLYPVGRLDFLSEGLLIMTNDGEIANLLTRASSGVEKTYVVKVAGQLTAEELSQLSQGVSIEKGEPGSERVRTSPATVRQIRPGENPWYEVILIEGRNREIRKMFSTTGHFVEKIRRVGYGPLVLDVEPGKFRELTQEELNILRLTAEGKLKPRRPKTSLMLPKEAGIPEEERAGFRKNRKAPFPRNNNRDTHEGRPPFRRTDRSNARTTAPGAGVERKPFVRPERPFGQGAERPNAPGGRFEKRPFVQRPDRPDAPVGRFEKRPFTPNRDSGAAGRSDRPSFRPRTEGRGISGERPRRGKPFGGPRDGPRGPRPGFSNRPDRFGKSDNRRPPFAPRPGRRPGSDTGAPRVEREARPERPGFPDRERRERLHIEEQPARSEFRDRAERSEPRESPKRYDRPRYDRPNFERPQGRGPGERSGSTQPRFGGETKKPRWVPRPGAQDRPGGHGRPTGMGRPSGGPGRPADRVGPNFGASPGDGSGRPGFGGKSSGFRKPGFRTKPGGGPTRRDRG